MITENLFDEVLIKPANQGNNELFVVSGYASATFANRHLTANNHFKLNLIIGMPGRRSDHLGYMSLITKYQERFNG